MTVEQLAALITALTAEGSLGEEVAVRRELLAQGLDPRFSFPLSLLGEWPNDASLWAENPDATISEENLSVLREERLYEELDEEKPLEGPLGAFLEGIKRRALLTEDSAEKLQRHLRKTESQFSRLLDLLRVGDTDFYENASPLVGFSRDREVLWEDGFGCYDKETLVLTFAGVPGKVRVSAPHVGAPLRLEYGAIRRKLPEVTPDSLGQALLELGL